MEENLSPLAVTHLLQHTLRSLCIHENSQWVYAVFWRILPRNYPPPNGMVKDLMTGQEATGETAEINSSDCPGSSVHGSGEFQQYPGLQPELSLRCPTKSTTMEKGKVAADHSHKWIYKEPNEQEINFLSAWHNYADSHPRTWEAQFQAGIKTIALIAVREGVVQLGAVHKVIEDPSYVVLLRKKFSYIESIPGALLPHPSSSAYPFNGTPEPWAHFPSGMLIAQPPPSPPEFYDHFSQPTKITPSMSSLEALLSKLPSVVPLQPSPGYCESQLVQSPFLSSERPVEYNIGIEKVAKQEIDEEYRPPEQDMVESSTSISAYRRQQHYHQHHPHDLNLTSCRPDDGF
ncbi:hypothetical protein F3Y22_tig00013808pilonHSYRG00131 [Hibiscus syriacus]|uniref:Transcription factor MYC/MYB N-terminal domain-containing protein n=1 Tax=Hibiscus syriacus TaxID=106335 RepID=A0A6A3C6J6_HIBSY|nr:hypothetical protein F3Y22_tig00013808pilonHSYRG00131 [Hibiscus syriacus]